MSDDTSDLPPENPKIRERLGAIFDAASQVTNIAAKRNAQWLEGAEHGRKAERDRILEILGDICGEYGDAAMGLDAGEIDEQLASASRRFVDDVMKKLEQAP